ncbi:MAG: helix-turn-helix domain-containing protein [Gammaproteobacteria bacterium]|uniref:helix-turn-helix domain-containing protein n=1 Tax=Rhodoferax sp. TaxID=50421 RepID=UPI0017ABC449|nr:helix-turn-helix domain-containing protein [Rhodoferax sp.]MBU3898360.1 helix-turn-helix domain-containing protein [Gammaproteobacteria bacterium]MBA3059376.1 helix-turn-helix domain-containing protein [Rhodoferax sp.]MBU3996962.1 helix-turn-helix domain-containing protein [Gammaproteobacteria bacterium]MBU4019601.1 helix-turn-helix domain-containing protein [Gammaproteobacteria bacterium]MBU4079134.1 helix-turn-helix domain-containing protein [Gammaproteobacteria bacterium]
MQTTANVQIDIQAIQASWQAFDTVAHLRPIRNESDYERMVELMNSLLDKAGDDEDHPLSSLLELASDLVSRYEQEHHAIEPATPKDALRFLMEARGLKQEDLSAIVPQSNLSAILVGKRKISAAMAGKLGKFFGVSPAVFVPR